MLVYFCEPLGVLHISRLRIYGRGWHRKPVDIPYEMYVANRDCLIDATYRTPYLRKHFGQLVPETAFTVGELKHLPREILKNIASGMKLVKRRGPQRGRKSHGVPSSQSDLYEVIVKALHNVT